MTDDVIRNPKRGIPKTQEPYQPEYVRKGIEPLAIPFNEVQGDFVVDGNTVDENKKDMTEHNGYIDNNEYVSFGYAPTTGIPTPPVKEVQEESNDDAAPKVGDYILMIFGKLVMAGSLSKIEQKAKNILYGDDANFSSKDISVDDIVVLKRVNVRVGVFISNE